MPASLPPAQDAEPRVFEFNENVDEPLRQAVQDVLAASKGPPLLVKAPLTTSPDAVTSEALDRDRRLGLRKRFMDWLRKTGQATRQDILAAGIFPATSLDSHLNALWSHGVIEHVGNLWMTSKYVKQATRPERTSIAEAQGRKEKVLAAIAKAGGSLTRAEFDAFFPTTKSASNARQWWSKGGSIRVLDDGRITVARGPIAEAPKSAKKIVATRKPTPAAKPSQLRTLTMPPTMTLRDARAKLIADRDEAQQLVERIDAALIAIDTITAMDGKT